MHAHRLLITDQRAVAPKRLREGGSLPVDPTWDWPQFWSFANTQLRAAGYRTSTCRLYRQILRSFRKFCLFSSSSNSNSNSNSGFRSQTQVSISPSQITRAHIRAYLHHLGARHLSASWIGMNTSVLRTLFDRIAGQGLTANLRTPKCPRHLPRTLSPAEIHTLLASASNPRDRLLLSLLYGCGLKVSEAASLQWNQFTDDGRVLQLPASATAPEREVPVPERLQALVKDGRTWAFPGAYVFPGRRSGRPLSPRTAEHIIRQCACRANLGVATTSMTLRHTFAVHALQAGMNLPTLQEILGHRSIETTLIYQRCLLPPDAPSPLDQLSLPELFPESTPTTQPPTQPPAPIPTRTSPLRRLRALIASAMGKRPSQRPPD